MQKIELEPDDKPMEVKPFIRCSVRVCSDNLFGYCQIMPNIDKEGICIRRRINEDRNKSR